MTELLDMMLIRLAERGHNVASADDGNIKCSCGWRYQCGVGDSLTTAALGHLVFLVDSAEHPGDEAS